MSININKCNQEMRITIPMSDKGLQYHLLEKHYLWMKEVGLPAHGTAVPPSEYMRFHNMLHYEMSKNNKYFDEINHIHGEREYSRYDEMSINGMIKHFEREHPFWYRGAAKVSLMERHARLHIKPSSMPSIFVKEINHTHRGLDQ